MRHALLRTIGALLVSALALATLDPAARAAEAHADGWLGKPFEYEDLEATVRRFAARPAR